MIDAVAAQRDAHVSRLYWYTDFEQARAAAAAQGKPILSLRLLGRLDTELSCANSRFFRTVLYANAEISSYLREHYILHWQSVRPVPVITIDFGDGRKIRRTITGNSIHYILTPAGRVVDALPGLYAPVTFLNIVRDAQPLAGSVDASAESIRAYQLRQHERLQQTWQADLDRVLSAAPREAFQSTAAGVGAPTAGQANERAVGKRDLEAGPIAAIAARPRPASPASADDEIWGRIADLYAADAKLDRSSVEMIRAKHSLPPAAVEAARRAMTKSRVEDPLLRIVRNFERSIAEDTVRNQYQFRTQILAWLTSNEGSALASPDTLNERVYAELFLTPSSDPWLGLVPDDTYAALDAGGIVAPPAAERGR